MSLSCRHVFRFRATAFEWDSISASRLTKSVPAGRGHVRGRHDAISATIGGSLCAENRRRRTQTPRSSSRFVPGHLARDVPTTIRMDDRDLEIGFEELRRLVLEEGQRTRSHLDTVIERLAQRLESGQSGLESRMQVVEWRAAGVENLQKVISAEIRGLVARLDRLAPVRR